MKKIIIDSVVVGLSGAASIIATDALLTRVDPINRSRVSMGVARSALGLLGAFVSDKAGAPSTLSVGVASGPLMVTAIEAAISAIPRRRPSLPTPPQASARALAQPWGSSVAS